MVDWEEQWELHCPYFKNGKGIIPLKEFGIFDKEVILEAGGGFGDLSHPTTRLCLQLGLPYASGRHVIDLGCGSGILGLAAAATGALSVSSIDIEPAALEHTQRNAKLNKLTLKTYLSPNAPKTKQSYLVFCNMILSEQKQAWQNLIPLLPHITHIVVSGFLQEQENQLLVQHPLFTIVKGTEEAGWSACILEKKSVE